MNLLYYYSKLNIGGAERSTVRLVNSLAKAGHQVTLLLRWNGPLEADLDPAVRCIHLKKEIPLLSRMGKVGQLFNHFLGMIRLIAVSRFVLPKEQFDVAINGLLGYDPAVLFDRVRARAYFQMLRNDVTLTRGYGRTEELMERFGHRFDGYIGVSEYVTESFRISYPHLAAKAHTVYNILPEVDKDLPRECPAEMAKDKRLRILTVCRLEEKSKGLLRMANVANRLSVEFPGSFCWYIVGDGPDRNLLANKIQEFGLEGVMVLCGKKNDPFPYYAFADLVAVLSYYEGLCGVVNEAKLMERPVIATRFSGIDEQITNDRNGLIVENDEAAILEQMRLLLKNPLMLDAFRCNGMPNQLCDNAAKVSIMTDIFHAALVQKEGNVK